MVLLTQCETPHNMLSPVGPQIGGGGGGISIEGRVPVAGVQQAPECIHLESQGGLPT